MLRVALKLALASAAVWAVWTFVPVGERTLAARWAAAPNLSAFLDRGLAEVAAAWRSAQPKAPRAQARAARPPPRELPTEGHTEEDRQAIERILATQLSERR